MKLILKLWIIIKDFVLFIKQISVLLILIGVLLYWLQNIIESKQEEQHQITLTKQKQNK